MEEFLRASGHLSLFLEEAFLARVSSFASGIDLAICLSLEHTLAMQKAGIPVIGIERAGAYLPADLVLQDFDALEAEDLMDTYRRVHQIPKILWESERLVVRQMAPEDYESLRALYEGEGICDYMEPLGSQEETMELIDFYWRSLYPLYGMGGFLLLNRAGKIVGRLEIKPGEDCGEDEAEIGYLIGREWQKRGYAREALHGLISYAKGLGLTGLVAHVHPQNEPSKALLSRFGFVHWQEGADYWHLDLESI